MSRNISHAAMPHSTYQNWGLYLHVPFCNSKCHYCNYTSRVVKAGERSRVIEAMLTEIRETGAWLRSAYPEFRLSTVYIGGGTPSALHPSQLNKLLTTVYREFGRDTIEECTIEANPVNLSNELISHWEALGITRLSLGIQTFNERLLRIAGRPYTSTEVTEVLRMLKESPLTLSCDLICGFPGQTLQEWADDLSKVAAIGWVSHLSVYPLTLTAQTKMAHQIKRGKLEPLNEDLMGDMLDYTEETLPKAGFNQYEISNFARRNQECRHNLNYWEQGVYLGFGPGAASHIPGLRWKNIDSLLKYSAFWKAWSARRSSKCSAAEPSLFQAVREYDPLSMQIQCSEAIILGTRLGCGFDLPKWRARYGIEMTEPITKAVKHHIAHTGLLEYLAHGRRIALTRRGRRLANQVWQDFLP